MFFNVVHSALVHIWNPLGHGHFISLSVVHSSCIVIFVHALYVVSVALITVPLILTLSQAVYVVSVADITFCAEICTLVHAVYVVSVFVGSRHLLY